MREYLFRGKRKDNGEWVLGSLIDKDYILQYIDLAESWSPGTSDHKVICRAYEVIPETIGLLSGHENKLFDGDIVNYVTGNPKRYVNCVVRFGEYETYTKIVDNDPDYNNDAGEVENHIGFYLEDGSAKIPIGSIWIEKIGNIFDNPELLTTTTNT